MGNWTYEDLVEYQDQVEKKEEKKQRGINPDEVADDKTLPQPKVVKTTQTATSTPTDWADLLPKPDMERETKIAQSRVIGGLFGDIARGIGNIAMTKGKNGGWMPAKDNGVTERAINILSDTEAKKAAAMRDYAAQRAAATMSQRKAQMEQQTDLAKAQMTHNSKLADNATKVKVAEINAGVAKHKSDVTVSEGEKNRKSRESIDAANRSNQKAIADMQHSNNASKNAVSITLVDNPTNVVESATTRSVSFANKAALDNSAGAIWNHIVASKYGGNASTANEEFAKFLQSKAEVDPQYAQYAALLGKDGRANAHKSPEAIVLWATSIGDKGINDFIASAAKGNTDDNKMPLIGDDDDNTMPM